ncbi:hypothetical protein M434DRAFT_36480 [Hypoxylon sp. CO27-5]|nr:hypothetical protein M434DRAFT_36480 [Hypoxylon sp. CO27-5]
MAIDMKSDHATEFYLRYHRFEPRRQELMVPLNDDFPGENRHSAKVPDTIIQIGKFGKAWGVHLEVITNQSNYFRRALAGGFLEGRTKTFHMYEVNRQAMGFVVEYLYHGWDHAASVTFGGWKGDRMTVKDISEVMILADYLDIPTLCYVAYSRIHYRLAALVVRARDVQFAHYLCVRRKPFAAAIHVLLKSKTVLGHSMAMRMKGFLSNLKGVNDLPQAVRVYREAFEGDWKYLDEELQW